MTVNRKNIAVVLAGGTGSRLGGQKPKQFFEVKGKMVIEYAVTAFEINPLIDEIAIVSHPNHITEVQQIVERNGWAKVKKILPGGKERYHSTLSAIEAYQEEGVNLILHDAARPLVSQRIITEVCQALIKNKACGVAIPTVDTILVCKDGIIQSAPDRSALMRAQTPQAFHIEVIREAFAKGLKDPHFQATDDCGILLRYMPEIPIRIVVGEESNLKVTYADDLRLLELFLP